MLRELRVRNYAVIDDLGLELAPGLNVLTGETGAGKSIIVGALSLLLGERASSEDVRAGEERALVEAAFDVQDVDPVMAACREAGIEPDEGWLVLRREVQREGRNRAWVNGSPATAGLIWEFGSALVELHGQHEHQLLLERGEQRAVLDAFAGAGELAGEVERLHGRLTDRHQALEEVRERASRARERSDWLRFKAEEIAEAGLSPGEEEELRAEARRLENSEELTEISGWLHDTIYGDEGSVVDRLGEAGRRMNELVRLDPDAEEFADMLASARTELEELGRRLARYSGDVDHDPARLERVRERLDEIYRLQRKYGETVEEVIEAGRRARDELDAMEGSERRIEELEDEIATLEDEIAERAAELGRRRREAADRLTEAVEPMLAELGLDDARFEVALEPLEEPGPRGGEVVEFRVSLNPGFEPGPLRRVSSGGELSRLMLALKTVLARVDDVPSLVFDEIDAGVGGQVAHRVAEKLAAVAERHQVFVITHLPQIAARAGAHWRVEKETADGRAATRIALLEGEERVEELARMLGGDPESGLSRDHARELLEGTPAARRS